MDLAYRSAPSGRHFGLLLTVLMHAALIASWHMVRTPPPPQPDLGSSRIMWIPLSLPKPERHKEAPPPRREAAAPRSHAGPALAPPALPVVPAAPSPGDAVAPAAPVATTPAAPAASADAPSQQATQKPSAEQILQQARRDIGRIDKGLRKENNPYIAAPLDSPQIRMRQKMEEAAALAPGRIWEAPKVEELVNNTGDGSRRTRIISGNGTYCVTERATNTNVEMIEHHGKLRITNCPTHETPAKQQGWRTLRD